MSLILSRRSVSGEDALRVSATSRFWAAMRPFSSRPALLFLSGMLAAIAVACTSGTKFATEALSPSVEAMPSLSPTPTSVSDERQSVQDSFDAFTGSGLGIGLGRLPLYGGGALSKQDLEGFVQLLERDAIRPIYRPLIVAADEADLGPDELVIGVQIGGESRAYPVGILRFREIANDALGDTPILVTW